MIIHTILLQGKCTGGLPLTDIVKELMEKVEERLPDKKDRESFKAALYSQGKGLPDGGDVLTTLKLLITAVCGERCNFKEEISRVIMQGGEGVCVHASVVGGVLGLIFGYSNLPQDWLIQLPQENIKFMNAKLNLLLDLFGLP